MSGFRYSAYLSYSHRDERWARWLHRALEAYRIPSALVGSQAGGREVPARLPPVFRDRDDLSSAANLGEGLHAALRDSESLIVICSPDAVASRWVNEEIRYFLSLGRGARIFCVLVADAGESGGAQAGFPPALLEQASDQLIEPLAVDPRPYADGRELAKLKLVAGLLGLRLDDLRRRQQRRKRRWQAVTAAAAVFVVALVSFLVLARQAELRERDSAEQMAGFIVDLGEELKSAIDLEALALISRRAMTYLADIDPGNLRPETAAKVGLALRQLGQVSDGQGRNADARDAFFRSRELFADLNARYPQSEPFLFELAQAEFYVATHFFYAGEFDAALPSARRYAELANQLYAANPTNPEWQLEVSYAATGLLAMAVEGGGRHTPDLLSEADRAIAVARGLLTRRPDDAAVISNYADTLAWAADARMLSCELERALEAREDTLRLAEQALKKNPGDNFLRQAHAYAQSGVAVIAAQLGRGDIAAQHWQTSIAIIDALWREDPSNEALRGDLQFQRLYLVRAMLDAGELDAAVAQLETVLADFPQVLSLPAERADLLLFVEYRLAQARVARQRGNRPALREEVRAAIRLLAAAESQPLMSEERAALAEAYHHWWSEFGELPAAAAPLVLPAAADLRSCGDAVSSARIALMQGQAGRARDELEYLQRKSYRAFDAAMICEELGAQCPQSTNL